MVELLKRQLVGNSGLLQFEHHRILVDDFVQAAPNRYLLRPVMLGAEVGGVRVVMDGVREDETIVVDGAFHLNNERRRQLVRGEED